MVDVKPVEPSGSRFLCEVPVGAAPHTHVLPENPRKQRVSIVQIGILQIGDRTSEESRLGQSGGVAEPDGGDR